MQRVLIVKLSSLGDVIHAMPVVADLRGALPGVQIDWVVEPGFAPLVRRVEGMGKVIECAQRRWRKRWWTADVRREKQAFRAALQQHRYAAVLDLQGLTKSALVARQALLAPGGLRYALGNRTDGSGWEAPTRWLADRAVTLPPHIHVVDRSRQMAAQALDYPVSGPPWFGLRANLSSPPTRTLVFVHGTSRDDKLWPETHWIAFGRGLVSRGWRIALPQASDEEVQRAARLAAGIGPSACDLWPRMSLDALVDCMGATQGVVGVDSGLSHLAVALNLPHVQLYNFPTAWRTGPLPAHGHLHQVSVGGASVPALEAVEAAWHAVARAGGVAP